MGENFQSILKEYWGFDTFRAMQEEIIASVYDGKDTLAVLPTGGGKSICFQVPAMAKNGICIVVSPLIALIKDQLQNLKSKGIPALAVYSGMKYREIRKTLQNAAYGNFKFLYVSPERLETELFREFVSLIKVNLIAVDEAHCISQWGYDFRPSYLKIADLRQFLPGVPLLALTASATAKVQDDICEKLAFSKEHVRFQKSFERANLSYSVFKPASKQNKLLEIVAKVPGTAIVYCKSRKRTTEVAQLLKMNGFVAEYYHAGLENEIRSGIQDRWIKNETRVIASTNAFGMGIDKPDVRLVVHYDVPDCLENYYQEAGRAGRDEKKAFAVLLYSDSELKDLEAQSSIRFPGMEQIREVYKSLMNYLQLPAGSGEEQYFDLDIVDFSKKFKLDIHLALHAIKALEQEGLLSYSEQFFQPSTAVFSCNRTDLETYIQLHPDTDPLIKGLLRSYEGIFDYPAEINEKQFSDFVKIDEKIIRTMLVMLDHAGIIDYSIRKDKPQVRFLQNRVVVSDLVIDYSHIRRRKEAFDARVKMMVQYVKNEIECRSKIIGQYFNDTHSKNCGICDNCLDQKKTLVSKVEMNEIVTFIKSVAFDKSIAIGELINQRGKIRKEKLWKVIDFLFSEQMIESPEHGHIRFRNVQDKKKGPR